MTLNLSSGREYPFPHLEVLVPASTIGVLVYIFTDFTFLEGLLLGSIVSSTDAAAVFSILRSRSIGLKGNLRRPAGV